MNIDLTFSTIEQAKLLFWPAWSWTAVAKHLGITKASLYQSWRDRELTPAQRDRMIGAVIRSLLTDGTLSYAPRPPVQMRIESIVPEQI